MKVLQGNALDVLKRMEGEVFDALISDPPYASGGMGLSQKQASTAKKYTGTKEDCPFPDFAGDNLDQRAWTDMMRQVLTEGWRLSRPGAVCALFVDWRQYPTLTDAFQQAGWIWRGTVVWDKITSRPQKGRFRQQAEFVLWGSKGALPIDRPVPVLPGVFREVNVQGAKRLHQTQKPIELMRELVKICVPGGHILDPFAGSGSTLEAAKLEGYEATGIEWVPEIARVARERVEGVGVAGE